MMGNQDNSVLVVNNMGQTKGKQGKEWEITNVECHPHKEQ